MICPTCGSQIGDNLKFCTQCGTPLANAAPAATYQPQADNPTELFTETPVYQNTNAQSDVYQPGVQQAPVYQDTYQPAAPDYSQAPVYSAPFDSALVEESAEKGNITGLIFGIISLVLAVFVPLVCCCTLVGTVISLLMAIAAIILGSLGIKASKKSGNKAGLILSVIGLCLGCVTAIIPAGFLTYSLIVFILYGTAIGGTAGLGMLEQFLYNF